MPILPNIIAQAEVFRIRSRSAQEIKQPETANFVLVVSGRRENIFYCR
jgi:hypothetical protein